MKINPFLLGCLSLLIVGLVGCKNEPTNPYEDITEQEGAPKCDGTVKVRILGSRAASAIDPTIDRLTATRCDAGTHENLTLVSYHGRNKEEIGMVQVLDRRNNNEVISEIYFEDARVNYCVLRNIRGKMTAYVGVDRGDKIEKGKHLCGIVAVDVNEDGTFELPNNAIEAVLSPYYVDGVSVNCIKLIEQKAESALVVASGGNNALANNNRAAGFTKFRIDKGNPRVLEKTKNNKIDENYRGYWISHNVETDGGVKLPVAYTYRTLDGKDLVYKLAVVKSDNVNNFFNPDQPFGTPDAEVELMRRTASADEAMEDFGRFSVSMFIYKQGRFLIVSTGSKVLDEANGTGGGTRIYRFDHQGTNGEPELSLVDVWNKPCYNTTNKNIEMDDGDYIYAAAAEQGVFKCKIDYYEDGVKDDDKTPIRYVQLIPVKKRVTDVITESDTYASTNYVQCDLKMKKVHVAGGYEGYYTLDLDDATFIDADPRKDLKKH